MSALRADVDLAKAKFVGIDEQLVRSIWAEVRDSGLCRRRP